MRDRSGAAAAWVLLGVAVLLVAAWAGLAVGRESTAAVVFTVVIMLPLPAVGGLIATRQPRNRFGWLLLVWSVAFIGSSVTGQLVELARDVGDTSGLAWASWLNSVAWVLGLPVLPMLVLLFPDGRPPSARWRWVVWLHLLGVGLAMLGAGFADGPLPGIAPAVENPLGIPGSASVLAPMTFGGLGLIGVSALASVGAVISRWRRADGEERQQLRWVAVAGSIAIVVVLVTQGLGVGGTDGGSPGVIVAAVATAVLIPAAIGVAVLRYRLYDLDLLINRTVVYVTVLAALGATYAAVVSVAGWMAPTGTRTASIVAAAVIAVLFGPLHERVRAAADRWLFGDRNDPYRAVKRLGEQLHHAGGNPATSLAGSVAEALRLPYVEVRGPDGLQGSAGSEPGTTLDAPLEQPLVYRGERVGSLRYLTREPGGRLPPGEQRLLVEMAQLVAVAVRADALATEVQQARTRLVHAVEDERRRLRRDLHDGLGPSLAGLSMGLERVNLRLANVPGTAEAQELVAGLASRIGDAIDDVRRLVYDLRPPALDDLGLVGALRAHVGGMAGAMEVEVDGTVPLPPLSAALETAVYRIAMEALTNVARHAGARRCTVAVTVNGALELSVADDGVGPDGWRSGVGLQSMRERALELGGALSIDRGTNGGTVVSVRLPLEEP